MPVGPLTVPRYEKLAASTCGFSPAIGYGSQTRRVPTREPSKMPVYQLSCRSELILRTLIGVGGHGFDNVSQLPDGARSRHHHLSQLWQCSVQCGRPGRRAAMGSPPPPRGRDRSRKSSSILLSVGHVDRLVGGATLVLFIALFLPWFSVNFGGIIGTASASGLTAHGYLYITLILSLAILGLLVAEALGLWKIAGDRQPSAATRSC